ncbi:MAG: MucR family transcriptional regulator [Proteobacteria bacterium]|nr:MucR family transcriptional regulator [Pseudomonadota bacterium]
MASNLLDLTAEIVGAHASVTEMTSDELLKEIKMVYATLEGLEKGEESVSIEMPAREPKKLSKKTQEPAEPVAEKAEEKPAIPVAPALTIEEAFKPDQVACMICGKTGMTTLKRHLTAAHNLKPGQYRKQFNIPKDQPLAATDYIAKRRQIALDRGLGDKLAAARAARKAKQTGE